MTRDYYAKDPSKFHPVVEGLGDSELRVDLELALAQIKDPRHKRALLLRLQNLTYQEIADEIGVSKKTIHKWLNTENGTVVELLRGFFDD